MENKLLGNDITNNIDGQFQVIGNDPAVSTHRERFQRVMEGKGKTKEEADELYNYYKSQKRTVEEDIPAPKFETIDDSKIDNPERKAAFTKRLTRLVDEETMEPIRSEPVAQEDIDRIYQGHVDRARKEAHKQNVDDFSGTPAQSLHRQGERGEHYEWAIGQGLSNNARAMSYNDSVQDSVQDAVSIAAATENIYGRYWDTVNKTWGLFDAEKAQEAGQQAKILQDKVLSMLSKNGYDAFSEDGRLYINAHDGKRHLVEPGLWDTLKASKGETAGAVGGAIFGAKIGGTLGSVLGVPGMVAGALVGGTIGGIAGGAGSLFDYAYNTWFITEKLSEGIGADWENYTEEYDWGDAGSKAGEAALVDVAAGGLVSAGSKFILKPTAQFVGRTGTGLYRGGDMLFTGGGIHAAKRMRAERGLTKGEGDEIIDNFLKTAKHPENLTRRTWLSNNKKLSRDELLVKAIAEGEAGGSKYYGSGDTGALFKAGNERAKEVTDEVRTKISGDQKHVDDIYSKRQDTFDSREGLTHGFADSMKRKEFLDGKIDIDPKAQPIIRHIVNNDLDDAQTLAFLDSKAMSGSSDFKALMKNEAVGDHVMGSLIAKQIEKHSLTDVATGNINIDFKELGKEFSRYKNIPEAYDDLQSLINIYSKIRPIDGNFGTSVMKAGASKTENVARDFTGTVTSYNGFAALMSGTAKLIIDQQGLDKQLLTNLTEKLIERPANTKVGKELLEMFKGSGDSKMPTKELGQIRKAISWIHKNGESIGEVSGKISRATVEGSRVQAGKSDTLKADPVKHEVQTIYEWPRGEGDVSYGPGVRYTNKKSVGGKAIVVNPLQYATKAQLKIIFGKDFNPEQIKDNKKYAADLIKRNFRGIRLNGMFIKFIKDK